MRKIKIRKASAADKWTCNVAEVSKDELLRSSRQHIADVKAGLTFFTKILLNNALDHDKDKIDDIDGFYKDFKNNFKTTDWWDNHRTITNHHLNHEDGIPENVNLLDVLEYIVDCVMAGMARSGRVYDLEISESLLMEAFNNTVELLKDNVKVEDE